MKHILCPVDGSEHSQHAVKFAANLAQQMKAKLTLLTVREYVLARGGAFEVHSPEDAASALADAKKIAKDAGIVDPPSVEVRARDVAYAILDVAEKNGADHIVMGAAGKGEIKRLIIGSVSSDVIRKAHVPVTIVH
jgi:nucleotide-binding universal stress UspA family protein